MLVLSFRLSFGYEIDAFNNTIFIGHPSVLELGNCLSIPQVIELDFHYGRL
jgi:hypothetical protein